jgi:O-antigen/teichoic acid export membrane protein
VRSLLFIAGGWILPVLVFLLATPVLVAHLGFDGYGVFALTAALVAAGITLDFGLGALAVRQLARSRGDVESWRRRAAGLNSAYVVLAAAAAALVWAGGEAIARALNWDQALPPGEAAQAARWGGLWLGLAFLNAALSAGLRAAERFDLLSTLATAAFAATWAAAAIGAAWWGLRPGGTLALAALVAALQLLLAAWVQARVFGRWPRLGPWPRLEAGAARFAGAAFLNQATSLATYHADKAIVSALLGASPAGMYAAATNVANKPLAFVAALAGILFPRIAALESQGRSFLSTRTYLAASRMLVAASSLFLASGLVLAGDFIGLWLGPAVPPEVTTSFRILLVAYWFAALSVAPSNTLVGQGNAHRGALFALAGGVLTLVACVLLVPRLGMAGAAVAGLIGMSQAALFELWAHREAQARHPFGRFALRRTAVAVLLCGGGAAAAAAIVSSLLGAGWTGLAASALAGTVVFVAMWFGLGLAAREERLLAARLRRALLRKGR